MAGGGSLGVVGRLDAVGAGEEGSSGAFGRQGTVEVIECGSFGTAGGQGRSEMPKFSFGGLTKKGTNKLGSFRAWVGRGFGNNGLAGIVGTGMQIIFDPGEHGFCVVPTLPTATTSGDFDGGTTV